MAYIGNSPTNIQRGRRAVYEYTATAGQTVFTGVDNNGLSLDLLEANENDVYLNGSRLVLNDDYTVSGDTLTLISAAELNDILIIVTQDEVANAGSYTKAESDTRYINYNGDIVNGDIQVVGTITADSLVMTQSGTVDGRDIAADGTKLDGIEANADVTDTTNVAAAGALMTTGGTMTGAITSEIELGAIAKDISDTAVDVFIYDTRKDSDGGAWRKRTQHTSWYNETLNTATRGSRKEFPAVAVIVSDSVANRITIYDADDPDMPMWMEFIQGSAGMANTYLVQGNGYDHSVYMLNGILATGYNNESSSYGQPIINFISEKIVRMDQQADGNEGGTYTGNIATRNDSTYGYVSSDEDYDIVNGAVNDVAMTVLPNAPIDAATGLPVPTIAVATDGGVSVIKDNGTVVDYTGTSQGSDAPVDKISFIGTKRILFSHRYASEVVDLVSSDNSAAYYNQLSSFTGRITNSISHDDDIHVSALSSDNNIESIALNEEDAASKSVSGLSLANHYQVTSDPDRVSCFIHLFKFF
jgi:hypothetical protein